MFVTLTWMTLMLDACLFGCFDLVDVMVCFVCMSSSCFVSEYLVI